MKGLLLIQLGSPKSPSVADVRTYLRVFLGDKRVVDLPRPLWLPLLYGVILPTRPLQSAKLYRRIWDGQEFPLPRITAALAARLAIEMGDGWIVKHGMIIGSPSVEDALQELKDARCEEIVALPLFPQYAEASTASALDALAQACQRTSLTQTPRVISDYHNCPEYIETVVTQIETELRKKGIPDLFVLSFHGYPLRRIQAGDPYKDQALTTARLITERLSLPREKIRVTFQSKFGREEWLKPATDALVCQEASQGARTVMIACPGFAADCLETIDELGHELKKVFHLSGGKRLHLVPCVNDDPRWVKGLAKLVQNPSPRLTPGPNMQQWPAMEVAAVSPPLSPQARQTLKVVFLILFIDLIGFSIIFPLFPAMLTHYTQIEGETGLLGFVTSQLSRLSLWAGGHSSVPIVLFGGVLGTLYGLLQFLFSPIWGALSDRIGRKPILLFCLIGIALSYLGWVFAGSFLLLILSRTVGGMMAGNISVATAAVADVTSKESRSKGMAIIGIAFGLGFVVGPALGGMLSLVDLREWFPTLISWGLNPFSTPALFACVLSLINIVLLLTCLQEPLPPERRGKTQQERTINPLAILQTTRYPGVSASILTYFLFLVVFSGMEFTLTFLAAERFQFTPTQNGMMFVFVGIILSLVQGGYVRRKAHVLGEDKLAIRGLALIIPGLLFIGYARSVWSLYLGLFFLAVGSAMAIPCLTALTSLYAPETVQGKVLGIFRSMGSLSRALGPILAALLYWSLSSTWSYLLGAMLMIFPLLLALRLPSRSTKPTPL